MTTMDIDEAEVLLAQKLANCDPAIRKKAFSQLRQRIASRMSSKEGFQRDELITLWKGLYYCMWMQDKPLLHEELAERLCSLGDVFTLKKQHVLYLDTFLETLAREWFNLDKWRVDKFLMLLRRFFRHTLEWLKSNKWNGKLWDRLETIFSRTLMSSDANAYPEELKCHFASIYLDELDMAGVFDTSKEVMFRFLDVYIKLFTAPISHLLFNTIQKEIFDAIVVDYSESVFPKKKTRDTKHFVMLDPVGSSGALQIDYQRIADILMEKGKAKSLPTYARKAIFPLVKQFRAAANGQDPFAQNIEIMDNIGDKELDAAAKELLEWEKSKPKGKKRKHQDSDQRETRNSDSKKKKRSPTKASSGKVSKKRKTKKSVRV